MRAGEAHIAGKCRGLDCCCVGDRSGKLRLRWKRRRRTRGKRSTQFERPYVAAHNCGDVLFTSALKRERRTTAKRTGLKLPHEIPIACVVRLQIAVAGHLERSE